MFDTKGEQISLGLAEPQTQSLKGLDVLTIRSANSNLRTLLDKPSVTQTLTSQSGEELKHLFHFSVVLWNALQLWCNWCGASLYANLLWATIVVLNNTLPESWWIFVRYVTSRHREDPVAEINTLPFNKWTETELPVTDLLLFLLHVDTTSCNSTNAVFFCPLVAE